MRQNDNTKKLIFLIAIKIISNILFSEILMLLLFTLNFLTFFRITEEFLADQLNKTICSFSRFIATAINRFELKWNTATKFCCSEFKFFCYFCSKKNLGITVVSKNFFSLICNIFSTLQLTTAKEKKKKEIRSGKKQK